MSAQSSQRAMIVGLAAVVFAGIAGGEAFHYAAAHQTIDLVIAVIAALVVVLIIGTTAVITRRSGKPPTSPVD